MNIKNKLLQNFMVMKSRHSNIELYGVNTPNSVVSCDEILYKNKLYYIIFNGTKNKVEITIDGVNYLMNSTYSITEEKPDVWRKIRIGSSNNKSNIDELEQTPAFITFETRNFCHTNIDLIKKYFDDSFDKTDYALDESHEYLFKIKLPDHYKDFYEIKYENPGKLRVIQTVQYSCNPSHGPLKILSSTLSDCENYILCNNLVLGLEVCEKMDLRIKNAIRIKEQRENQLVSDEVKNLRSKLISKYQSDIDKIKDVDLLKNMVSQIPD